MQRILLVFGLIVFSNCIFSDISLAGPVKLMGMSSFHRESMTRISFVFDRLPEFEVEDSGQRVRVLLAGTRFAESFAEVPGGETLVRVKTRQESARSVVELYFRNVPRFVDVQYDEAYFRLDLLVFWDKKGLGGRPSILARQLGRLKPDKKTGASAQRVLASRYSGRWMDFFREFEWLPEFSLPVRFSLPGFPSPLVGQYQEYVPPGFIQEGKSRLWARAAQRSSDLLAKHTKSPQADLYRLLLAECLLRDEKIKKTEQVLEEMQFDAGEDGGLRVWKVYLLSQARARTGRYFQADRLLKEQEKAALAVEGLAPWYTLLQAELALAVDKKKPALELLNREQEVPASFYRLYALRKADSLYELGRLDQAYALYQNLASDLRLLQDRPRSLANISGAIYQKDQYDRAYRYYFLLSETLGRVFPDKRPLADYWSAMARLRAGERTRARLMLWELDQEEAGQEAGYLAWLKLLDLDLLENKASDLKRMMTEYNRIIELGPTRRVREEAFFKQVLACHLQGEDLRAVKLLARFFEDYWAGALHPDAQSLLVELLPKVVAELVQEQEFFPALTLVAKHRDLLAQARMTYDFLIDLAESYARAGFFGQAAETYLYILDFEDKAEKKDRVYPALIRIYHRQQRYEQVRRHAESYLRQYPEGEGRDLVLYYYADALLNLDKPRPASRILLDKNRPQTPDLDRLAGYFFFEQKQYDLAEFFLSRVLVNEAGQKRIPETVLKRAEALFLAGKWDKAVPLYESLLEEPDFKGQAGYRLVRILVGQKQRQRALKLYSKLTELEGQEQWLDLAAETLHFTGALAPEAPE
ncbi:MAG: hypothetical protein K9K64_16760 [Desulfohalobiaceae bacterium]|nr:hypothetical protein [Desulfohalobiaceae bacterium]